MADSDKQTVTRLLLDWRQGDENALNDLLPQVYEELRRLARRNMRGERKNHTLETTALVHEAYVRLIEADVAWQDRVHFFAVAAGMMRRILIDHARAARRVKRGGGADKVGLDEALAISDAPDKDVIDLDEALKALAEKDPRKSRILELHYFGGLSYEEIAEAVSVSPATVHRELRFSKAWLHQQLTS